MCPQNRDNSRYKLETVSRALSRLHELGIIGFIGSNQRQIVLMDRQQLASLDLQN